MPDKNKDILAAYGSVRGATTPWSTAAPVMSVRDLERASVGPLLRRTDVTARSDWNELLAVSGRLLDRAVAGDANVRS